jgi:hypothetical protein
LACSALIAWRTGAGALSIKEVEKTSPVLAVPVCAAQALMVPGFVLLSVAGFCLCARYLKLADRADGSTS